MQSGVTVKVSDDLSSHMASREPCPQCGEDDVWLEERATFIQYGCNLCDHYWRKEKAT